MAIKGIVGAVYEDDTAPISDNVALLFDWTLQVDIRKEYTYGPELHGVPVGWWVKAKGYWTMKKLPKKQMYVRLFLYKGTDKRCLAGWAQVPVLKKANTLTSAEVVLHGVEHIKQEG